MIRALIFCLSIFLLAACHHPTIKNEPSFYYWKNANSFIADSEMVALHRYKVQNLYIRFFDVGYKEAYGPLPEAKQDMRWRDGIFYMPNSDSVIRETMTNMNLIPTVYIQNKVLKRVTANGLDSLAANIVYLIKKHYDEKMNHDLSSLKEIQIDCDWTESTQAAYFSLLKAIRRYAKTALSCTLRLYPYKYPEKMGVPPVDRVSLMCYNLLNPFEEKERNSILDKDELRKYLKTNLAYPLPLDIALPLFAWMHIYQYNQLVAMEPLSGQLMQLAEHKHALWYKLKRDTVWGSHYFRKGDDVKIERVDYTTLMQTLEYISEEVPLKEGFRLTLFHLDENTLKRFTHAEIHSVFNAFN